MHKIISFSIALFWPLLSVSAFAGDFAGDILRSPVTIQIGSNHGSGVYLASSNGLFIVTAAHCVFDINSPDMLQLLGSDAVFTSVQRGTNLSERCCAQLDLRKLLVNGMIKRHATHDVVAIKIGDVNTDGTFRSRRDWVNYLNGKPDMAVFWTDQCSKFDNVMEGDDSYIMGYPLGLYSPIHNEIDFSAPIMRKGIIAQKNQITKKLIIDSAVYGGNSGGPVLTREANSQVVRFQLVGIITQYIPNITQANTFLGVTNTALVNSGYGVAEPVDFAFELMCQFPVKSM